MITLKKALVLHRGAKPEKAANTNLIYDAVHFHCYLSAYHTLVHVVPH